MFAYLLMSNLIGYHSAVKATPILIERTVALDTLQDLTSPSKRTLSVVVWSCVSTVLICAWTSVHPNVPPQNKWKARWNRLKLIMMFWMIVAPELVLVWAVRQHFGAKDIRDTYNDSRQGEC